MKGTENVVCFLKKNIVAVRPFVCYYLERNWKWDIRRCHRTARYVDGARGCQSHFAVVTKYSKAIILKDVGTDMDLHQSQKNQL